MTDPATESLQLEPTPSKAALPKPRLIWHLVTNQLNLMYVLAAGLMTGPKGMGRKHYSDASAVTPGWIPLFPDRIPMRAFDQARSEGAHLRALAAVVDVKSLVGPVRALDDRGQLRELHFPDGLYGTEQVLLVPAPLPTSWIEAILFASKEERSLTLDEAGDYGNVPLTAYKQRVSKRLFQGVASAAWPPDGDPLSDRDAPSHQASAVGAALALLFALGNSGDWVVNAGEQIVNALDHALEAGAAIGTETGAESGAGKEQEPLLRALLLWAESASASDIDEVSTCMLLAILNAIVAAKLEADSADDADYCPPAIHQVVLDVLAAQGARFAESRPREALTRLVDDLQGLAGLGADTVSEVLTRHPKAFSRGLILFFLRQGCDELLDYKQPLLTDQDRVVAAALFAARSGWIGIPGALQRVNGLGAAVMHRMAAIEHRTRETGLEFGPAPSFPRSLRALFTAEDNDWNKRQREGALALSRAMGWQQLLRTRISLGKGEYRLKVDARGAHLLLDGDVKAVDVEVDRDAMLSLLADSTVPERVDARIRAVLKASR